MPYPVSTVHNAAIVKPAGKYIMIFRSHKLKGRCSLGMAQSNNGYNFSVEEKHFMVHAAEGIFKKYEPFGIKDPQIVFIDGAYLITCSPYPERFTSIITDADG